MYITEALSAHQTVDNALQNGNHQRLLKITRVQSLLNCDVDENYQKLIPVQSSSVQGTMFFLPLPLSKTMETLNQVQQHASTVLPDPELYIIVNGRPTKSNVVWRSLVNVNHVKTAIRTLRSCNWLYRNVEEKCIDETTKHIIEVSNNATTEILKKVSPDEVDAFQAYTVRNLDNKLLTGSDIEQYRLVSITENPLPFPISSSTCTLWVSSLATAFVLINTLGRDGHPAYLARSHSLIPNWAYSTLYLTLYLCVSFTMLYFLCSEMTWRTIPFPESWWKPPASNYRISGELSLFCSLCT